MLLKICSGYERMRCSRIKQHNWRSVVDENCTNDQVWSFLGLLHCDVIDLSMNIVLSSSNRNIISPMGRHRGGPGCLRRAVALTGALVGKVTFLPTSEAPLSTLIPCSRSLGVVGAQHHLALWGRLSLPSYLRLWLEYRLSRMKHRSS
jgi:hypothetical protein